MSEIEEINYGPLNALIGIWKGDKGTDVAPESDGKEINPFYETFTFEKAGDITNGEEQVLSIIHYRRIVKRKSNNKTFHDETGYWMWDSKENVIMHSLNIPRGVSLLAGSKLNDSNYKNGKLSIDISAGIDNKDWGIVQSPFMKSKAMTKSYNQKLVVENGKLKYEETTMLDIYGREFEHTDINELVLQN